MFEFLTNTAVVNAHAIYKSNVPSPKDIVTFREQLVSYLLEERLNVGEDDNAQVTHRLKTIENRPRGRCTSCYERLSTSHGRIHAAKATGQVRTACVGCPDQGC